MYKCPLFYSDFNETYIFAADFRKNDEISNFMRIRTVGAELLHTDGQTDMTKLIIAFRNFANAPEIALTKCNPAGRMHHKRHKILARYRGSEPRHSVRTTP